MRANVTGEERTLKRSGLGWPIAVAATILVASSRSQVAAPPVVNIDKIAHFAVYGLLATLLCRVGHGWRAAFWALLVASAFGATDEWHQVYVPGRAAEVMDWIADTTGAALAVALYTGWHAYRRALEMRLGGRRRFAARGSADSPPTAE